MIINLKQQEITAALTGYILQQGISLFGKKVAIEFTAGRKASGISAEITIEDDPAATPPAVEIVDCHTQTYPAAPSLALVEPSSEVVPEEMPTEPEEEIVPTVKTSSLFG